MRNLTKFYIDGAWTAAAGRPVLEIINPADETAFAQISLGNANDVDDAAIAARNAFDRYAQSSRQDRLSLFEQILEAYQARYAELAAAISEEMGAPIKLAMEAQAATGLAHFQTAMTILKDYKFTENRGAFDLIREPVGVVGLITPWNWPVNQIACKVAPALAAGCTIVLKPSEVAPVSACILTEILDAAGVPKGVFNMVNGTGPEVGAAIAAHPEIDMVSFTGSTRAGVEVAKAAAPTVKRVAQELGGKSANIILDDADLKQAVSHGVIACMMNSGQSCNAPTRMLIPAAKMNQAAEIAEAAAATVKTGDPKDEATMIGPVASAQQWAKIQRMIDQGLAQGARLVAGGTGKPEGLEKGYYVKPTVFANVTNDMTIAREEIFGPVLSMIAYADEDDAVAIANDTPYGLAAYVFSGDLGHAEKVAKRLRAGQVQLNGAGVDFSAPFGGYKQSGNGREWGEFGFEDFLETKAVIRPAG